jgi:hypothetical protein
VIFSSSGFLSFFEEPSGKASAAAKSKKKGQNDCSLALTEY